MKKSASKWSENINGQLLTVKRIDAIIISNLGFTAFSSFMCCIYN